MSLEQQVENKPISLRQRLVDLRNGIKEALTFTDPDKAGAEALQLARQAAGIKLKDSKLNGTNAVQTVDGTSARVTVGKGGEVRSINVFRNPRS